MSGRSFLVAVVLLLSVSIPADSQTVSQTVVSKDPTAVSLLSRAVNALTQGLAVNNVTLTATVTRTAGSDVETGTATLKALGGAESRVNLTLTDGPSRHRLRQQWRHNRLLLSGQREPKRFPSSNVYL